MARVEGSDQSDSGSNLRDAFLDVVSRFVREKCRPLEAQISQNDRVPDDLTNEMARLGLYGLSIPEQYGGLGLSLSDECAVIMVLGHTSPAIRSAIGTNVGIGSQGLVMFGTEAQKQQYLPGIAAGQIVTSFALTEAEAGSDAASLTSTAVRDGEFYVLNGAKRYITNANRAHLLTVMARTDSTRQGASGVSAFLVPRLIDGVRVGKPERKMGQQGAHICDIYFDNVRVPAENRLGAENEGFKVAMAVLDRGRIHIAAMCVGVAERLIEDSLAYATTRRQFGKNLAEFQMVQAMLADSQTELYAARSMVMDAAKKRDEGDNVTWQASAAKLFASEMVGRVADRAVQIFGGAGYVADHGIERFYRDVRIFRIYEGASEIQKLVIAREMVKNHRQ